MSEAAGPAQPPQVPWEFTLPPHFSREAARLQADGIGDWPALAQLDDARLRQLAGAGGASEARLIKLRGQARLVIEVGVSPADAALLLYAGIANGQGLAQADPDRLQLQLGRFQRQLMGRAAVAIDPLQVRRWILQARGRSSRSPN